MVDNKISEIIRTSLENVKEIVDGNTIIGDAIPTPNGTIILPVSKVSVGIATGGVDYKGKNSKENDPNKNFGGGGGTGVSVTPIAFLVVRADGSVDLLNVSFPTDPNTTDTIDIISAIIKKSPDIISKIKSLFKKERSESADIDEDLEEDM